MPNDQTFTQDSFAFLNELQANNNREQFTANKTRCKALLETPFAAMLEALANYGGLAAMPRGFAEHAGHRHAGICGGQVFWSVRTSRQRLGLTATPSTRQSHCRAMRCCF